MIRRWILAIVVGGVVGGIGEGGLFAAEDVDRQVKKTKEDLARAEREAVRAAPKKQGGEKKDAAAEQKARLAALARTIRESSDYRAQCQARDELIAIGLPALPIAAELVQDEKQLVRIFAILIMREAGQKVSVEEIQKVSWNPYLVLFRLLSDEDPKIRLHASLALHQMTGFDAQFSATGPKTYREFAIERYREYLLQNGLIPAKTPTAEEKEAKTEEKKNSKENGKPSSKKKKEKSEKKAKKEKAESKTPQQDEALERKQEEERGEEKKESLPSTEASEKPGTSSPFREEVDESIREPEIVIVNHSEETITVRLEGPIEKKIHIAAGRTQRTKIPEGSYRYVALAKDVEGAEGEQTFQRQHRYTWTFRIEETE